MRLPVIQTCGECGWHVDTSDDPTCVGHCTKELRVTAHYALPPSWCPLRTGPDAERIAALEAVASAAARVDSLAYRANLTGDDWMSLTRALRSLT